MQNQTPVIRSPTKTLSKSIQRGRIRPSQKSSTGSNVFQIKVLSPPQKKIFNTVLPHRTTSITSVSTDHVSPKKSSGDLCTKLRPKEESVYTKQMLERF